MTPCFDLIRELRRLEKEKLRLKEERETWQLCRTVRLALEELDRKYRRVLHERAQRQEKEMS